METYILVPASVKEAAKKLKRAGQYGEALDLLIANSVEFTIDRASNRMTAKSPTKRLTGQLALLQRMENHRANL